MGLSTKRPEGWEPDVLMLVAKHKDENGREYELAFVDTPLGPLADYIEDFKDAFWRHIQKENTDGQTTREPE